MEILKCNNLSASYEGDAVLGSLSFTVNEGDYLCILGETARAKVLLSNACWVSKKPTAEILSSAADLNIPTSDTSHSIRK